MNFEDMQKAWQSHDAGAKVLIDADVLLNEVRRNQQNFRATILWRDAREIGVAAIMAWLFLHWAVRDRLWPLYLVALACIGVGAFMVVDRLLQRRKQPAANVAGQSSDLAAEECSLVVFAAACHGSGDFHRCLRVALKTRGFSRGGGLRLFTARRPGLLGHLPAEPVRRAQGAGTAPTRIGNAAGEP